MVDVPWKAAIAVILLASVFSLTDAQTVVCPDGCVCDQTETNCTFSLLRVPYELANTTTKFHLENVGSQLVLPTNWNTIQPNLWSLTIDFAASGGGSMGQHTDMFDPSKPFSRLRTLALSHIAYHTFTNWPANQTQILFPKIQILAITQAHIGPHVPPFLKHLPPSILVITLSFNSRLRYITAADFPATDSPSGLLVVAKSCDIFEVDRSFIAAGIVLFTTGNPSSCSMLPGTDNLCYCAPGFGGMLGKLKVCELQCPEQHPGWPLFTDVALNTTVQYTCPTQQTLTATCVAAPDRLSAGWVIQGKCSYCNSTCTCSGDSMTCEDFPADTVVVEIPYYMTSVQLLNSKSTVLPGAFAHLKLIGLVLDRINVPTLSPTVLQTADPLLLQTLSLARVDLSQLPQGLFDAFVNLKRIGLSEASLTTEALTGQLWKLEHLTHIFLPGNNLTMLRSDTLIAPLVLPVTDDTPHTVERLDLSNNNITIVHPASVHRLLSIHNPLVTESLEMSGNPSDCSIVQSKRGPTIVCDCADDLPSGLSFCLELGTFTCSEEAPKTISISQVCDGVQDCPNNEDEISCVIEIAVDEQLFSDSACSVPPHLPCSETCFDRQTLYLSNGLLSVDGYQTICNGSYGCHELHGILLSNRSFQVDDGFDTALGAVREHGSRVSLLYLSTVGTGGATYACDLEYNVVSKPLFFAPPSNKTTKAPRATSPTTQPSPAKSQVGPIFGGVFAAVIVAGCVLFWFWHSRQSKTAPTGQTKLSQQVSDILFERVTSTFSQRYGRLVRSLTDFNREFVELEMEGSQLLQVEPHSDLPQGFFTAVLNPSTRSSTPMLTETVLVKQQTDMSNDGIIAFHLEARLVRLLDKHPHFPQLVGFIGNQVPCRMLFLPVLGSLRSFLKQHKPGEPQPLGTHDQLLLTRQIASAMTFLESLNILHRNLSSLTVHIRHEEGASTAAGGGSAVVTGFGMARDVYGRDMYQQRKPQQQQRHSVLVENPMHAANRGFVNGSPEVLADQTFTIKSDVWAFGVVVWEIFSFGRMPYGALEYGAVLEKLESGYRLQQPNGCNDQMYSLLMQCWHKLPSQRPTFAQVYGNLMVTQDVKAEATLQSHPTQTMGSFLTEADRAVMYTLTRVDLAGVQPGSTLSFASSQSTQATSDTGAIVLHRLEPQHATRDPPSFGLQFQDGRAVLAMPCGKVTVANTSVSQSDGLRVVQSTHAMSRLLRHPNVCGLQDAVRVDRNGALLQPKSTRTAQAASAGVLVFQWHTTTLEQMLAGISAPSQDTYSAFVSLVDQLTSGASFLSSMHVCHTELSAATCAVDDTATILRIGGLTPTMLCSAETKASNKSDTVVFMNKLGLVMEKMVSCLVPGSVPLHAEWLKLAYACKSQAPPSMPSCAATCHQLATKGERVPAFWPRLEFVSRLGSGQFGEVNLMALEMHGSRSLTRQTTRRPVAGGMAGASAAKQHKLVAVKVLLSAECEDEFLQEMQLMTRFHHPNLVSLLYAVTDESPKALLLEYFANGALSSWLPTQSQSLTNEALLFIAHQVACGMSELASLSIVHRDLAARNVLVGTGMRVAVSDYGLSRVMHSQNLRDDDCYYRLQTSRPLPVRWMAPEVLATRNATTASDIWSYGVLLYEIFSFVQALPFDQFTDMEVIKHLAQLSSSSPEVALQLPPSTPHAICALVRHCLAIEPQSRPTFPQLVETTLPGNWRALCGEDAVPLRPVSVFHHQATRTLSPLDDPSLQEETVL
eukprot:m.338788 g.338788  ORF g.338788 m.338788 type:complete len:1743 (-) comp16086_c1_seq8:306-5534(-)